MSIVINGKTIKIGDIIKIKSIYNLPNKYKIADIFKADSCHGIEIINVENDMDYHIIADIEIDDVEIL